MIAYLNMVKTLLKRFKEFRIMQIPQEKNEQVDVLAKLALAMTDIWSKSVPVSHLSQPSISEQEEVLIEVIEDGVDNWMTPIT